jgi:hypothetical protein
MEHPATIVNYTNNYCMLCAAIKENESLKKQNILLEEGIESLQSNIASLENKQYHEE